MILSRFEIESSIDSVNFKLDAILKKFNNVESIITDEGKLNTIFSTWNSILRLIIDIEKYLISKDNVEKELSIKNIDYVYESLIPDIVNFTDFKITDCDEVIEIKMKKLMENNTKIRKLAIAEYNIEICSILYSIEKYAKTINNILLQLEASTE